MNQMKSFFHDLEKQVDTVSSSTRPLTKLGIHHFYYFRVSKDGTNTVLSAYPDINHYYYENKLYLKAPFLKHPHNFESGFFSYDQIEKKEFDHSLGNIVKDFEMVPLIGLCRRHNDYAEFFNFWTYNHIKKNSKISYWDSTHLLNSYADFFLSKNQKSLTLGLAPSYNLKELIGSKFEKVHKRNLLQEKEQSLCSFLTEIGFGHFVEFAKRLSRREKECINLMLQGKINKEIAQALKLSTRTIEFYFENIKNKLNCHYKHEVYSLVEKMQELGLI